jgi:predicted dehydrogenase
MTITAAVIGCGNISQYHFSGLEKCGANVKWVCDLSEESARPYAEQFEAQYTANYMDTINDSEVDVIFVILISSLHKEICTAAIKAGKAVVCEKTLAVNSKDAAEITNLAREHGTLFYTSYMKRFFPAAQKAKKLLPQLGQIIVSYVRVYQPWGNLWSEPPTEGSAWTPPGGESIIRKNYGGGILTCGGSHMLDITLFLLGRPDRLFGSVYTPKGFDYELQSSALMETANNGVIHFDAVSHEMNKAGDLGDGWDEHVEINGVNGRLDLYTPMWTQFETKSARLIYHDKITGLTTEYHFDCVSPFDLAVAHFCEQIEKGEQGEQSIATGYEVDELISSIELSSKKKQVIEIPWKL